MGAPDVFVIVASESTRNERSTRRPGEARCGTWPARSGSSGPTEPGMTVDAGRSVWAAVVGTNPGRLIAARATTRREGGAGAGSRRHVIRARILARIVQIDPPILPTMASGTVSDAFLAAIRHALPGLRLLTDAADRESYRRDETAYLPSRAARRRGPADGDGRGRPSGAPVRRVRRPDRAARRGLGAERRRDRHRGRPDHRLHGDGPHPRDRRRRTCAS